MGPSEARWAPDQGVNGAPTSTRGPKPRANRVHLETLGLVVIDGAPDQHPKNLEHAGAQEQIGLFEYHGAPGARWSPDQEPFRH